MLNPNITYYTEAKKAQAEENTVFFAPVGSVIRSKKTGLLWSVIGFGIKLQIITKEHGKLYTAKLQVTCQDGTTTEMFNELMTGNFEVVDLSATQCDKKTFKGLRNLIGLHCAIDGVLANKAHKCYQFKAAPYNLIKSLMATSLKSEKLVMDNSWKIDHKDRTALIFGRVTPLFNFKGRKA